MRGTEFLDKMELIDPAYVEAAEAEPKKKKNVWVKWGAIAACLCFVIMGIIIWRQSTPIRDEDTGITVSENGVTIPQMDVSLSANEAADMIGFFIYQGRCYVQYERIYDDVNIIGEHLGTATGSIDEWTPADGYVDFAGTVNGDFYAINGISPEFMLCMRFDDGSIHTYINDNGITLKTGTDLFEDRFHISETCSGLTYAWYNDDDEYFILKESYQQELTLFLKALDQASFLPSQDAPYDFDQALYHIDLTLESGMNVRLRLFPEGYVYFDSINGVFLKMETKAFERFAALLDTGEAGIPARIPAQRMDGSVTYDDCLSDATLGGYIPHFTPDGMQASLSSISYHIDRESAKVGNAKGIRIEFDDAVDVNRYYSITVLDADACEEYEELHCTIYEAESFTLEDAAHSMQMPDSQGNTLEEPRLELGVRIGNIIVILSAKGLDEKEGYLILSSIL